VVGDSTANAVASAQAGKNSSENNNLGGLGSYGQASAHLECLRPMQELNSISMLVGKVENITVDRPAGIP